MILPYSNHYGMACHIVFNPRSFQFYVVYAETPECKCVEEYPDASPFPHCTFGDSLLKVYTMLMGEIGNEVRESLHRNQFHVMF